MWNLQFCLSEGRDRGMGALRGKKNSVTGPREKAKGPTVRKESEDRPNRISGLG